MFLGKAVVVVRRIAGLPGEAPLRRLHSARQLRQILARERARADRTGTKLSLVTFAPRGQETDRAVWVCLAKILGRRLRSTDEVGWLDRRRIGAVLPDTPAAGAWKAADDICSQFPDHLPPPPCAVYSYPSDWSAAEDPAPQRATSDHGPARRVDALEILFLRRIPVWKRVLDVAGATAGLILLLPLFAAVALAVKLSSPGPILFKQRRSGWGGRPFVMYKFRSMVVEAEARKPELWKANEQDGPTFKIKDDPRVTALGRFLRRSSIDELPQLWNVLKGDMSLVGPRPLVCPESEACSAWQRHRLDVTPGMTCICQVSGRSNISFAEWMRMDLHYVRSRSPQHDLKLLLLTVPAVILRKGAY